MDRLNTEEKFFVAGGSLSRNARSYVYRKADDELVRHILNGYFCYVLTPRQMGKSSLMVRTEQKLQAAGFKSVIIDLSGIGNVSINQWYQSLLSNIQRTLRLSVNPEFWWTQHSSVSPAKRFADYLRDVALSEIDKPIVIFIDEIDYTLHLNYKDDFFAAIRALYNARSYEEIFNRLTFVLLGVASPSDLINDRKRTPFNIGKPIDLEEFTREESQVLKEGLERVHPSQGDLIFDRIYEWTNGHPYFTQKLCLEIAAMQRQNWTDKEIDNLINDLFFSAITISESREENLKRTQLQIIQSPNKRDLLILYKQVHEGKQIVKVDRQSILQNELMLSGLVRARDGKLEVRNNIFRRVFDFAWTRQNLSWHSEYRLQLAIAIASTILVLIVVGYFYQISRQQPVDVLAQTYIEDFRSNTNPTLRLGSLANLIALPEREGDARDEFDSLTQQEKLSLFAIDTSDLQTQVRFVVRGIYFYLDDTSDDNEVLHAMESALEQSDDPESELLAKEISQWLEGRSNAALGKYSEAESAYNAAIVINEDNPATRFEHAIVLLALKSYSDALREFEVALGLDETWRPQVAESILEDKELYDTWWDMWGSLPVIDDLLPTPTSTPTPTNTSTNTNALSLTGTLTATPPIISPTFTKTPTPTDTPSPTPSPTFTPTPETVIPSIAVGEVIVADDFEVNRRYWEPRNEIGITVSTINGERVISARRPETSDIPNYNWPDFVRNESARDLILQVDAYIPTGSTAFAYGLIFGWQTGSNSYYHFDIRRDSNSSFAVLKKSFVDVGTSPTLIRLPDTIPNNELFQYTISVVIEGKTVKGYVDGQIVAEQTFEDYSGGAFGVMVVASSAEEPVTVHFDNFRAWRLP